MGIMLVKFIDFVLLYSVSIKMNGALVGLTFTINPNVRQCRKTNVNRTQQDNESNVTYAA